MDLVHTSTGSTSGVYSTTSMNISYNYLKLRNVWSTQYVPQEDGTMSILISTEKRTKVDFGGIFEHGDMTIYDNRVPDTVYVLVTPETEILNANSIGWVTLYGLGPAAAISLSDEYDGAGRVSSIIIYKSYTNVLEAREIIYSR